jgi:hypothetical protein
MNAATPPSCPFSRRGRCQHAVPVAVGSSFASHCTSTKNKNEGKISWKDPINTVSVYSNTSIFHIKPLYFKRAEISMPKGDRPPLPLSIGRMRRVWSASFLRDEEIAMRWLLFTGRHLFYGHRHGQD